MWAPNYGGSAGIHCVPSFILAQVNMQTEKSTHNLTRDQTPNLLTCYSTKQETGKSTSHLQDDAKLAGVITLIIEMYTNLQILSSGIIIWLYLLLKNGSQAQTEKKKIPTTSHTTNFNWVRRRQNLLPNIHGSM
jgi:hypothetical protein